MKSGEWYKHCDTALDYWPTDNTSEGESSAPSDPGSSSHDNVDGWMSRADDVDGWGSRAGQSWMAQDFRVQDTQNGAQFKTMSCLFL